MTETDPTPPPATKPAELTETTKPSQRSKVWHNVAVRLADEGVPVRAIVRALMLPADEVREALAAAVERGLLLSFPRDDWPIGTRRDERQPDVVPLELEDEHMVMLSIRTFAFTPSMAKIFVALLRRPQMMKTSLHVITQLDQQKDTGLKIVDVYICKMRERLKKYAANNGTVPIEITTIWAKGYYMAPADKEVAFRALGIKHDTFVIPADAPSDVNKEKAHG